MGAGGPGLVELFILITLFVALVAYTVTGGADFGVGIIEMLSPASERRRVRELSEKAIAPIWEANHVWIVLILVVLFVGFPKVHSTLVTSFHVPLLIMLVGIVLRGTAFTFRYYDIDSELASERLWTWLFRAGSLLVPLSFGAIAASLHSGEIPAEPSDVWGSYFGPWLTPFAASTAVFTSSLFAWVAAVFLTGELTDEQELEQWRGRSQLYGLATVLIGAATSVVALQQGVMHADELTQPFPLACLGIATLATFVTLDQVGKKVWISRIAVALASAAILAGYWLAHFPVAIRFDGAVLEWEDALAPEASLRSLSAALVVGLLLIGPGLAYLYKVFKGKTGPSS